MISSKLLAELGSIVYEEYALLLSPEEVDELGEGFIKIYEAILGITKDSASIPP